MRSLSIRKMLRRALTKVGAAHLRPAPHRSTCPPLRLEALEDRTAPATFTVMNTNDSGDGSLRQAILDANATDETNTITFHIGSGGVQTLHPPPALPTVTNPGPIHGPTQAAFGGPRPISIDC